MNDALRMQQLQGEYQLGGVEASIALGQVAFLVGEIGRGRGKRISERKRE